MKELLHVDGAALTVRTVEATDVDDLARMFRKLSRESVYYRFFSPLPRVPEAMLQRMADVDHCRRDAVVALDGSDIVAIASYDTASQSGSGEAEIAIVVDDEWQHRGVGQRLVCRLADLALERDYDTFFARTLPVNRAALALLRKLSPRAVSRFSEGEYEFRLGIDDLVCERPVATGWEGEK